MHHLIIALTCLFAFNSVVLGKNKIDLTALEGNYQGHVWNGGDTDPVFTIFRLTADKKLSGSYSIKEEGGIEKGLESWINLPVELSSGLLVVSIQGMQMACKLRTPYLR